MRTASEMLRDPNFDHRDDFDVVSWEALVQVVEAAEEWEEYRENVGMMRVYAHVPKHDLRAALTALAEHLEGGDVT